MLKRHVLAVEEGQRDLTGIESTGVLKDQATPFQIREQGRYVLIFPLSSLEHTQINP